ncbi:PREDICTED: RBPJ-interacting and tubulin-associated protein 1 [Gavialis gangeticus]|uniref:RBPJ-interacting and tubulin-associated protein 1 n=1 Tax=Gavialis gangeticus TaxID=94835 RepID=UPI00092E5895|nr:PREDICTED: RBPJ-interacting and tubulin-associated protein 1 [Gavialis gangeticus]
MVAPAGSELAMSGVRAARGGGRTRARTWARVRARASYVDETLFGRPVGARPAPPAFEPPWAAPPRALPRAGRLKSRSPSYCDESLFGSRADEPGWAAPRMKKEDIAKLHSLLWTPSSVPRIQSSLSSNLTSCSKETPLRAVHPKTPKSQRLGHCETEGRTSFWKWPESGLDSVSQGTLNRGHSQSLTQVYRPSDQLWLPADSPNTGKHQNQRSLTASVTSQGSLPRARSKSVLGTSSARVPRTTALCQPKPPWK